MPRAWASSIKPPQGGRPAQHGVDLLVVVRVIAVVGRRLEDRGEIHGVDAQIGEIIEVLDHADQVAPLIAVISRRRAPLVQMLGLGHRQANARTGRERSGRKSHREPSRAYRARPQLAPSVEQ